MKKTNLSLPIKLNSKRFLNFQFLKWIPIFLVGGILAGSLCAQEAPRAPTPIALAESGSVVSRRAAWDTQSQCAKLPSRQHQSTFPALGPEPVRAQEGHSSSLWTPSPAHHGVRLPQLPRRTGRRVVVLASRGASARRRSRVESAERPRFAPEIERQGGVPPLCRGLLRLASGVAARSISQSDREDWPGARVSEKCRKNSKGPS